MERDSLKVCGVPSKLKFLLLPLYALLQALARIL